MEFTSVHYNSDRQTRRELIQKIGEGNIIDSFVVDRGHPHGAEVHDVTDTAIIIIHNQQTKKLITELIARPEQLRRLYHQNGREVPKRILELAYKHNMAGYNTM